jgi:hypothetical protein
MKGVRMAIVSSSIDDLIEADARCSALARGLAQLSHSELAHLRDVLATHPETVAVDTYNYDAESGAWCPLAVALGVPAYARETGAQLPDNTAAKRLILKVGREKHGRFSLNPIKGIAGDFFRDARHSDLLQLVDHLLEHPVAAT